MYSPKQNCYATVKNIQLLYKKATGKTYNFSNNASRKCNFYDAGIG